MLSRRAMLLGAAGLAFSARAQDMPVSKLPLVPSLSPQSLTWPEATPEELAFMRRVYVAHLDKAGLKGKFAGDIPAARLGAIEGGFQLIAPAAKEAAALLAAMRADLADLRIKKDPRVETVTEPGVLSAYRPASHQFRLWNAAFPGYFRETEAERQALPDGPLGPAAVELQMLFVRRHLAAPGYSLHNSGRAIDFQVHEQGVWLRADRSQRSAWRQSWLYDWLARNAAKHRFHQNLAIDEPWHWEWR